MSTRRHGRLFSTGVSDNVYAPRCQVNIIWNPQKAEIYSQILALGSDNVIYRTHLYRVVILNLRWVVGGKKVLRCWLLRPIRVPPNAIPSIASTRAVVFWKSLGVLANQSPGLFLDGERHGMPWVLVGPAPPATPAGESEEGPWSQGGSQSLFGLAQFGVILQFC